MFVFIHESILDQFADTTRKRREPSAIDTHYNRGRIPISTTSVFIHITGKRATQSDLYPTVPICRLIIGSLPISNQVYIHHKKMTRMYQGGHGGAGRDLPPLSEIDSCSRAGPSRIRYGENDLPKICSGGKGLPPKKTKIEKPDALEPPFTPSVHRDR